MRWICFGTLSNKTIVIDGIVESGPTCLKVIKLGRHINVQGKISDVDIAGIRNSFHKYPR